MFTKVRNLLFLIAILFFMVGFSLGRHSAPGKAKIDTLKESVTILEKDLVYCWNELPLGCIREGSIDN
tara:strand:+ start:311 stop:514 length:204 start_codon:yes stop_codon:yes gene_type:complete